MAKVIIKNKDAFFNYELFDKFEAGLVLQGWEIKSIRAKKVQLKGAFVSLKKGEPYITNMNISQYMSVSCDETAPRKLLLHKRQIKKLQDAINSKGMTIVPTTLKLSTKGFAKLDIALAKGKSKVDKRNVIKKRDVERKIKKYL